MEDTHVTVSEPGWKDFIPEPSELENKEVAKLSTNYGLPKDRHSESLTDAVG